MKNFTVNMIVVREIFDMTEEITRLNISKLCFKGPMEDLTMTVNLQPAVTAVNLACLAVIEKENIALSILRRAQPG